MDQRKQSFCKLGSVVSGSCLIVTFPFSVFLQLGGKWIFDLTEILKALSVVFCFNLRDAGFVVCGP